MKPLNGEIEKTKRNCFGASARLGCVALGELLGATLLLLLSPMVVSAERPPNIIFIMADDLGYGDLRCYGQQFMKTPCIDALATQGIRFTQAYAGGSVCIPSRSVLMTGKRNGHTAARDNVPHYPTYLENDDVTIAKEWKDVTRFRAIAKAKRSTVMTC